MAEEIQHTTGEPAAEAGEIVHLPGPSYLPVIVAGATTLMVTGIVISWLMVALGAVVNVVAITRWIRETRRDIADLPLAH
jgi:hypothetical protein